MRNPAAGPSISRHFELKQIEMAEYDRSFTTERALMAAWRRLTLPFAVSWKQAGQRIHDERVMGLRRPVRHFTVPELHASPAYALDAAAHGAHVVVTDDEGKAAVMVSEREYALLRHDYRYLQLKRGAH